MGMCFVAVNKGETRMTTYIARNKQTDLGLYKLFSMFTDKSS